jgi:hypothetical protein
MLTNPFSKISFVAEPSGGIYFGKPGASADEQPLLPSGEPTFETRTTRIRVMVRYSALRAQHNDMPKYKEWSKRLVSGAESWFTGGGE